MCLAIAKRKGVEIAKKYLENGFENNDQGAGFAVAHGGNLTISKGFFTFDEFWDAYAPVRNRAAIIHFRWATHGLTNKDNCHPFELCDGEFAMVHNGVLSIDISSDTDRSDTSHFSELVMTPMLSKVAFDDPSLKYLVEQAITSSNKLIVMRRDGKMVIYNEKRGEWHNGVWYSNTQYKFKKYVAPSPAWKTDYEQGEDGVWRRKILSLEDAKKDKDTRLKTARELLEQGALIPAEESGMPDYTSKEYQPYGDDPSGDMEAAWKEYMERQDETSGREES